jgi:NADPH-dependent 2,4-dienoyl-CoA reductase/sulfur reductase-like enzyme
MVVYTPEYFQRERNITVRTGTQVLAISHPHRQVALPGGERLHYDRLVLATGARVDRSAIQGSELPHVFTLQTPADARRLKDFLEQRRPRRAVVLGAGYLGLVLAEVLRTYGLEVTILEAASDVLARQDPQLTELVRNHLERFHVALGCQTRVTTIDPESVAGVPCDLVMLACGLRPNVEMAAEAGIELGRTGALRVSDRAETNLGGVYAAGDCAEAFHLVTGRPAYLPLGTTANKMGRVAGANAAGGRERFAGIAGTCILRVCGLGVAVTGLSEMQARKEGFDPVAAQIEERDKPRYFRGRPTSVKLVVDRRTRRLLGGWVAGEDAVSGRINVIATALTSRMRLEEFAQLDLAYSPPFAPVWDPLLIAAQQLSKLVD